MEPETTWNNAIFDEITDPEILRHLNRAMESGELGQFEPKENIYNMNEQSIIDHAHETADNWLKWFLYQ